MFKRFSLILAIVLLVISCKKSVLDVDLKENIVLESVRFDRELAQLDSTNFENHINVLENNYPFFFESYTQGVLGVGSFEQDAIKLNLLSFLNDSISKNVYRSIQDKYKNMDDVNEAISNAYSYYNHYFSTKIHPRIFYFQSGFNQRVIIDSLIIGVGLDMCLGKDCPFYDQLGIPEYMQKKLSRELIAVDAMKGLAWSNFPFKGDNNLASNMIYEGKIQYLITALFPKTEDSIKFSYSTSELTWLERNEKEVWEAMVSEQMLYTSERLKVRNMISNAPFTQAFGSESPSKIGIWIGYQIVKSYMNQHPEVSIPDLMQDKDYVKILNSSRYNP